MIDIASNTNTLTEKEYKEIILKSRKIANKILNIKELYDKIKEFKEKELKKLMINNIVLGDGVLNNILLIGEAPGAQENLMGIPFCGKSGKLLDKILNSIGISRTRNCYLINSIFWRPPNNRRPTSKEIAICRPLVEKYISIINPKLIILVGSVAVESILKIKKPIKLLKSQYFNYTNCYLIKKIKTAIILHPSYILRQPNEKKTMWNDILKIKKELISKIKQ